MILSWVEEPHERNQVEGALRCWSSCQHVPTPSGICEIKYGAPMNAVFAPIGIFFTAFVRGKRYARQRSPNRPKNRRVTGDFPAWRRDDLACRAQFVTSVTIT